MDAFVIGGASHHVVGLGLADELYLMAGVCSEV